MAIPTNAQTTYDLGFFGTGTLHEDLIDVQVILGSTQTPAFSSFRKDRARDVVHSWTVDALSATATGGDIEGNEWSGAALAQPVRLMNMCQEFTKHIGVSDRERDANPAGQFRDAYEKQTMMAFKEITRNCESRIFATGNVGSATGGTGTSSRMQSISGFGTTVSAVSASGVFTADIINLSMAIYNNGVEPDSLWFAPAHKRDFFLAVTGGGNKINVRNIAATDNRFQANIEVMETPFGQLYAIIVDRFIPTISATANGRAAYYIMDRSMLSLPFFRPPQHKPMGKSGDSTRGIILMDLTLRLDHPSAVGMATGLTSV